MSTRIALLVLLLFTLACSSAKAPASVGYSLAGEPGELFAESAIDFAVWSGGDAAEAPFALARFDEDEDEEEDDEADDEDEDRPFVIGALLYLPNRIFDVFDLVRARVRLGLGFQIGARATKPASVSVGAFSTIYVGLHGPRGEAKLPWPAGFETAAGLQVSVADGQMGGPYYGLTEIGADFHAGVVGVAIGVDPLWELLDLLVGFTTIDLADDDL